MGYALHGMDCLIPHPHVMSANWSAQSIDICTINNEIMKIDLIELCWEFAMGVIKSCMW